jgi:hypothetical protein
MIKLKDQGRLSIECKQISGELLLIEVVVIVETTPSTFQLEQVKNKTFRGHR